MDNVKTPCLPEEAIRAQRVENVINDLKERLKVLRLQHDEVIHNSLNIIKEIDEVSLGLLSAQHLAKDSQKNSFKETIDLQFDKKVGLQNIIENFEKLCESHVLKESSLLFKRAEESLEKVETFLDKMPENCIKPSLRNSSLNNTGEVIAKTNTITCDDNNKTVIATADTSGIDGQTKQINSDQHPVPIGGCIKKAVKMFDTKLAEKVPSEETLRSSYASCYSIGYEGDNDDSECDLLAVRKNKKIKNKT